MIDHERPNSHTGKMVLPKSQIIWVGSLTSESACSLDPLGRTLFTVHCILAQFGMM